MDMVIETTQTIGVNETKRTAERQDRTKGIFINCYDNIPILNIPMMSDSRWHEIARKQAVERNAI